MKWLVVSAAVLFCWFVQLRILVPYFPDITNASEYNNATSLFPRHDKSVSLLAVVTCGWVERLIVDHKRMACLHIILANYVTACESGFDVFVVITTYVTSSREEEELEKAVTNDLHHCARINSQIHIQFESFEFRPLPSKAFGTAGDLAFRHREIFEREAENFDLFLVQEDDVSIKAAAISYFLQASELIDDSIYIPAIYYNELYGGEWYPSW
eukprot:CAMPEP_0118687616 /NCGR_PEP_ID=MMETSP0800-20121206/8482_1 /TAXON_ID=210618 ORGANISM="Striatella unipunctata, Strain CCMP2910" /NCGR_SAMPLE_ID=MMETSP0800 /ASSEMBLY_ACC=CAM_ASM_000638 /LENGTH=212 /DNA_ID=CAMNT_0006584821 /DNA_START=61 /DNA_END=696 /DNA_ORIENTATION=+